MDSDPFASIRPRLAKKLAGFSSDVPRGVSSRQMATIRPPRKDFPVPGLVLLGLRDIMGFPWQGPTEKVARTVYCTVDGATLAFEHRKFGFTICYEEAASAHLDRVHGQLRSALKSLEKWLEPYARELIDHGHAGTENREAEFYSRYRFFRQLAEKEYAKAETPPRTKRSRAANDQRNSEFPALGSFADDLNHKLRHQRHGFFHATAMVDAYFSRLEHILILLRAFTGKPLARGELVSLLTAKWEDKLKRIIDVTDDRETELLYARLKRLKERVRNPFAHGGMENDGGSINIHMPGVGAIPANLSKIRESVRFNFIPIEADDYSSVCDLFDKVDMLLKTGNLAKPFRLVDAGVDAAFDSQSLSNYSRAISGSDSDLEEFLEWWCREWERHANMDF